MFCNMCPRKCNIDRTEKFGVCGVPSEYKIARAALHFWEEPVISGEKGSGTVFFGGCNLRCPFCHNALLVTRAAEQPLYKNEEILAFLKKREKNLESL